MACDQCITAFLSLFLLRKKTGRLRSGKYLLRLLGAIAPVAAAGYFAHLFFARYLSYVPALALTMLVILAGEALTLSLFRLVDLKALFARFFGKKRKKIAAQS